MEKCFISRSDIMMKDKKINTALVLNASFLFPFGFNEDWNQTIDDALASCKLNFDGDLSLTLAQFQSCIEDFLNENCVDFDVAKSGCDLTEEHFRKCKNVPINCSTLTFDGKQPCCDIPDLLKSRQPLATNCERKCRRNETFEITVEKCFFDCFVNGTKLVTEETIDFDVVKKLLMENKTNEWEKPVSDAVEECHKDLKGSCYF